MILPTKFWVYWPFGSLEEVWNRFSRRWPWQLSWISDLNYFSSNWSTSHLNTAHQVSSHLAFPFWRRNTNHIFKMAAVVPSWISNRIIFFKVLWYNVKLHPAMTLNMSVGMWGCPLSQLPPHLQGYEAATTWVAELGSNHLQTNTLVI